VQKPKTSKLLSPRGDADNYGKAILDAITGHRSDPKGYWNDDSQIWRLISDKVFAKPGETPGHYVTVWKEDPS
tara:strand:- start:17204 stop:17422 length:219 start_codon:yes stop_codon:yes gene_type:complete